IAANIEVYIFNIDTSSENTEMIMKITELAPLFSIITVLIAPILEEIVFRKIIFGALYKRMNFILAGIISAVIFGLIHLDPTHLLIYTAMGLVFAIYMLKRNELLCLLLPMQG